MKKTQTNDLPYYSKNEELLNFISHALGAIFAVIALIISIITAVKKGDAWSIFSASVYGFTMIVLYTMSSLYHGFPHSKAKKVFRILDHCSIFLLIAGSYTPLTLCLLRPNYPTLAWTIFIIIWVFCILGIILNAVDLKRFSKFSMICYLAMGWCIILAIQPMLTLLNKTGILLLILGGAAYTVGAIIYNVGKKKVQYMHFVFHMFVLLGTILHFLLILFYALPVSKI